MLVSSLVQMISLISGTPRRFDGCLIKDRAELLDPFALAIVAFADQEPVPFWREIFGNAGRDHLV